MTKEKTILLFDADIFAYQICASQEQEVRWDEDTHVLYTDFPTCAKAFDDRIEKLRDKLDGDKTVLLFSDKDNFRKNIYSGYKSNRASTRKPLALSRVREYALKKYEGMSKPFLEGDDLLGILSTCSIKALEGKKIKVSTDKDLKCVPGWLYNPGHDTLDFISEKEANYNFFMQTLTGDITDGYPGCPSVGAVTAANVLEGLDTLDIRTCWEAIVAIYKKKGHTEEEALQQARCARILRASDYDFKTNRIKLWTPEV